MDPFIVVLTLIMVALSAGQLLYKIYKNPEYSWTPILMPLAPVLLFSLSLWLDYSSEAAYDRQQYQNCLEDITERSHITLSRECVKILDGVDS